MTNGSVDPSSKAYIYNIYIYILVRNNWCYITVLLVLAIRSQLFVFGAMRLDWFIHENVPEYPGDYVEKPLSKQGYSVQVCLISPLRFGKPMERRRKPEPENRTIHTCVAHLKHQRLPACFEFVRPELWQIPCSGPESTVFSTRAPSMSGRDLLCDSCLSSCFLSRS